MIIFQEMNSNAHYLSWHKVTPLGSGLLVTISFLRSTVWVYGNNNLPCAITLINNFSFCIGYAFLVATSIWEMHRYKLTLIFFHTNLHSSSSTFLIIIFQILAVHLLLNRGSPHNPCLWSGPWYRQLPQPDQASFLSLYYLATNLLPWMTTMPMSRFATRLAVQT